MEEPDGFESGLASATNTGDESTDQYLAVNGGSTGTESGMGVPGDRRGRRIQNCKHQQRQGNCRTESRRGTETGAENH